MAIPCRAHWQVWRFTSFSCVRWPASCYAALAAAPDTKVGNTWKLIPLGHATYKRRQGVLLDSVAAFLLVRCYACAWTRPTLRFWLAGRAARLSMPIRLSIQMICTGIACADQRAGLTPTTNTAAAPCLCTTVNTPAIWYSMRACAGPVRFSLLATTGRGKLPDVSLQHHPSDGTCAQFVFGCVLECNGQMLTFTCRLGCSHATQW